MAFFCGFANKTEINKIKRTQHKILRIFFSLCEADSAKHFKEQYKACCTKNHIQMSHKQIKVQTHHKKLLFGDIKGANEIKVTFLHNEGVNFPQRNTCKPITLEKSSKIKCMTDNSKTKLDISLTEQNISIDDTHVKLPLQSFIVPTFDTKVTEYFCSGWVFFLQTNFDFLTSQFWRKFFISFESYCCPELKLETIFHLWPFFVKFWGS